MKTVVHLSTAHSISEIRLFVKECRSLADANYNVVLILPHVNDEIVEGIHVRAVPRVDRRWQRMTRTVIDVLRKALQQDGDLYHFHMVELIPVGLWLRAKGKIVIYDVYEDAPRDLVTRDYLPRGLKPVICRLLEHFENFAARRFSALIAATPKIGERFSPLNERTIVINNYPIRDELVLQQQIPWNCRDNAVAYVGGISSERGVMEMVQALEYLQGDSAVKLELAGSFSSQNEHQRVMQLSGWRYVHELGMLNRQEVAAVLGRVRAGLVLFQPAPNHIEAQPNKLFEYMAAGIPVIASDFPLWRTMIEREGCGLVVDPLDPQAIAQKIEWIMMHPDEAEAMGLRGRASVERVYNWEAESRKLLDLYASLLKESAE